MEAAKPTRFGFFLRDKDGQKVEIQRVYVLVVHYGFEGWGDEMERKGNAKDVERLRETFKKKRYCSFRDLASPTKEDFFEKISKADELFKLFSCDSSKPNEKQKKDVPDLFILHILSHGNEGGVIFTDKIDPVSKNCITFTRNEVLQKISELEGFDDCLKWVNFGPCRGTEEDKKFSSCQNEGSTNSKVEEDSRKVTKISFHPNFEHNLILFLSTVETKQAIRDKKAGSWFVQKSCDVLDGLTAETSFADVLTMIQYKHHTDSTFKNDGQTPEFQLYAQRQLFLYPLERPRSPHSTRNDAGVHKFAQEIKSTCSYEWKTDCERTLRSRQATIFCNTETEHVERMDTALRQNLSFETLTYNLSTESIETFHKNGIEKNYVDMGCVLAVFFAEMTEDKGEFCMTVDNNKIPIGQVISKCVVAQNLIGRPKLFFFINQSPSPTVPDGNPKKSGHLQINATRFGSWLVFVSMNGGDDITKQLIEILEGESLKTEEMSLQHQLSCVISKNMGQAEDNRFLLASTLQYRLHFPQIPRRFVKPKFLFPLRSYSYERNNRYKDLLEFLKENIKDHKIFLLSAEPGMGKSTLMLEIARDIIEYKKKIVSVRLRDYFKLFTSLGKRKCDSVKFLAEVMNTSVSKAAELLKNGEIHFVLLDGFDELCPEFRKNVLDLLRDMQIRKISTIISTRPQEQDLIESTLDPSPCLIQICEFDEYQQIKVIKFEKEINYGESYEFLLNLEKKGLSDILVNPLHLTMLCKNDKVNNLYSLYDKIIEDKVMEGFKKSQGIIGDLSDQQVTIVKKRIELLQKAAQDPDNCSLNESETKDINETGIAWKSVNGISFLHKSFVDFLVCQKFVNDEDYMTESVEGESNLTNLGIFTDGNLVASLKFLEIYLDSGSTDDDDKRVHLKKFVRELKLEDAYLNIMSGGFLNLFLCIDEENLGDRLKEVEPAILNEVLRSALLNGSPKIANFLLDLDQRLEIMTETTQGENAIGCAIMGIQNGFEALKIIDKLFERNRNLLKDTIAPKEQFLNNGQVNHSAYKQNLDLAAEYSNEEVCAWIVKRANVAEDYQEVESFTVAEAKYLFALKGVPINALQDAVRYNNFKVADFLLSKMVDILSVTNYAKYNPFQLFIFLNLINDLNFMKHLHLSNWMEETTANNETVLHLAARYSNKDVCKWLVENGADLYARTKQGNNVFMETAYNSNIWDQERIVFYFFTVALSDIQWPTDYKSLWTVSRFYEGLCEKISSGESSKNDKKAAAQELLTSSMHLKFNGRNMVEICVEENFIDGVIALLKIFGKQIITNASLRFAAENSDLKMCELLIQNGADVQAKCEIYGATALHYAGFNESHGKELVSYFVEKWKLDVNQRDNNNLAPLHYALRVGYIEVAKALLENGADLKIKIGEFNLLHYCVWQNKLESAKFVHEKDKELIKELGVNGMNALHFAAEYADLKMCEWLIANGVDVHAKDEKWESTVLHLAAFNKSYGKELVPYFVKKWELDVNQRDNNDETPLHDALREENIEVSKALLENGADLKLKQGENNFLHYCVIENKHESAKFVHEKNNKLIKEFGADGKNAIHFAANYADLKMCEWLIENGIDVNAKNEMCGATVLHLAAFNKSYGKELVPFFVKKCNLDVNQRDNNDETPLHYALRCENIEVAIALLENGADLKVKKGENNLLHFCVSNNKLESAKFVHEKELIKELKGNGKNALHLAAECADFKMCEWLIANGIDVHAKDEKWESTVLHYAAAFNKSHGKELVPYFVGKWKLDVNQRNNVDETPLHYALRVENFEVAIALLENGADLKLKKGENNLLHYCVIWNKLEKAKFVHEKDKELIKEVGENGKNALHLAANCADLKMCEWLIKNGIDVHAKDEKWESTALHYAALNKSHGKELVSCFAKKWELGVNQRDINDETPLHYALLVENLEVAKELLENGADLKLKRGEDNLLHYSIMRNKLESAKFVHEKDKEFIKEVGENGKNALHLAAEYADLKMFEWLVGLNLLEIRALNDYGDSVLHFAAYNISHARELIKYLISSQLFDVNLKNKENETPLHYALSQHNTNAADELFNGADPKVEWEGYNILHYCVIEDNLKSAKFVHGKFPNLIKELTEDGETALHLAAEFSNLEMCGFLVENGVQGQNLTKDGESILHYASYNTSKKEGELDETIQYLSFLVSNVNETNAKNLTAYQIAVLNENFAVAEALLKSGTEKLEIQDEDEIKKAHCGLDCIKISLANYEQQTGGCYIVKSHTRWRKHCAKHGSNPNFFL